MKLAYQQLSSHLNKQLAPIYLICSDELLLAQETLDLIRATAKKNGFTERVKLTAENADWAKELFNEAHSISLFASQRILELDLRSIKFNKESSALLQSYASNPPPHSILLMQSNKLDQKSEQAAWFKSIEKHGIVMQIWPIPPEQLPQWLLERAKKLNINLSKQSASEIAEQAEGNLLAAAQEIEKLSLLQTPMDEKNLADNAHFTIFDLVDSGLLGNNKRSLRILRNLAAEDIEPTLVLWALTREIRTLAEIAKQAKQGIALGVLFNQFRIWDKRQPGARAFLKRHTQQSYWALLLKAAGIDRIIKGGAPGQAWNELEQLVLNL